MKRSIYTLIATTILGIAAVISATAQHTPKIDRGKLTTGTGTYYAKINLKCAVAPPVEFPKITITNTTTQTIPQGKKVYWQVNADMKGSITLQSALAPGQTVKLTAEARGVGGTPTAWYFK